MIKTKATTAHMPKSHWRYCKQLSRQESLVSIMADPFGAQFICTHKRALTYFNPLLFQPMKRIFNFIIFYSVIISNKIETKF